MEIEARANSFSLALLCMIRGPHADDEARKNWEKFGHPDGKQAMDLGIAIPLPTDGANGPVVLALLVFVGLVLPMGLAAWFLFSSSKYMGPNQIMQETLNIFLR